MLRRRDEKEVKELLEKIKQRLKQSFPSPEEARRMGWMPLYDPDGKEIVAYMKPNGDIIFADGTRVTKTAVEVDDPNDVEE